MRRWIEYWTEIVEVETGDIVEHIYMGNRKSEAIERAKAATVPNGHRVDVERVTNYGGDNGVEDREYEEVRWR